MLFATTLWTYISEPLGQSVVQRALLEMALIGISAGALGCWIVLYETSYAAESLSHGLLPGLVVAALIGAPLLLGGVVAAVVAAVAIALTRRIDGVSADAAVGIVITTMFGLGALLALSPASPPGISDILFGDPLGVSRSDLLVTAVLAVVVIGALRVLHPRLLAAGFDPSGAASLGASPRSADLWLLLISALAVLVAVQALGNLLVVAVLVGPAASARQLASRVVPMMALAAAISLISALVGLYLSYWAGIAAGAAIAGSIAAVYLLSVAFAQSAARTPPSSSTTSPSSLTSASRS